MAGKKQLGQILVDAGIIDEFQLKSALGYQKQWGGRLGKVLVENRFVTEDALVRAVHKQTGVPVVQLDSTAIAQPAVELVPVGLAERHNLMPIRLEGRSGKTPETLVVAMSDPTNLSAQDEVQFSTGKRVRAMLATESAITRSIRRHYHGEQAHAEPTASSPIDPQKIQFAGPDLSLDDMELVQGKLESPAGRSPDRSSDVAPPEDFSIDDPFSDLESLSTAPAPQPSPPPPSPPRSAEAVPAQKAQATASLPPEDDLPEVEIVEELPLEEEEPITATYPLPKVTSPDLPVEPEPDQHLSPSFEVETEVDLESAVWETAEGEEEPDTQAVTEVTAAPENPESVPFGVSGDLLGSPEAATPATTLPEKPRPDSTKSASSSTSAMKALLSRVGLQDGAAASVPPGEEPVPAPRLAPKDALSAHSETVDADGLADDIQKLLDSLEGTDVNGEPPQVAKASHLIAAVIRLLLRKEVISDSDLLDELRQR